MKNKRHLVFINQNAGYLMIDIVNSHVDKWDSITLITGKIIQRDIPLNHTIKVKKILAYDRTSLFKRLLTWTVAFLQMVWLVAVKHRKSHLYIVSNPPFATLLPLFCGNPFSLLIFDVYPDVLTESGIIKENSFFVQFWKSCNRRVFSKALNIFVLSNGMRKILSRYVSEAKIAVVPLWSHNDFFKPVEKQKNPFIIDNGLLDKFVVMYSGNLGLTHNLSVLVEVATKVSNPDIIFLIIGEGESRSKLQLMVNERKLVNFKLLPWQEVSMLPYSMAAAQLGVVSLGKQASLLSVPSKTFNLLSAGVPLLCLADSHSELATLVNQHGCGKCFDEDAVEEIRDYIESVAGNTEHWYALHRQSIVASLNFTPENVRKLIA